MSNIIENQTSSTNKTAILFSRDQLVNTATISRQFSKVKLLAKIKPLFITDNGNVDSVLLSYEAYEQLVNRINELESEVLESRSSAANKNPETLVDFGEVRRSSKV
mgnify:CR=1 FL=1